MLLVWKLGLKKNGSRDEAHNVGQKQADDDAEIDATDDFNAFARRQCVDRDHAQGPAHHRHIEEPGPFDLTCLESRRIEDSERDACRGDQEHTAQDPEYHGAVAYPELSLSLG